MKTLSSLVIPLKPQSGRRERLFAKKERVPPSSGTENEGGPSMAEETGIPQGKIISC